MTLKLIAISAIAVALLSSCGNSKSPQAQAGETTETAAAEKLAAEAVVTYTSNKQISPDASLPIVIDFNATWCGPCQRFAPTFHAVASEMQGKAIFMSVDVDMAPEAAKQFGVEAIPQISILMPDGTVTSSIGYMEKGDFLKFLEPIS